MLNRLSIRTHSRSELMDITGLVRDVVHKSKIENGVCYVFVPHTTAGITINENADPSVRQDILAELNKLVPWQGDYSHLEGNASAHIKASLVGSSETIPVEKGDLVLGTWQGVFFAEFDGPRRREVWVTIKKGSE
ncbi:MAG: secondary thiamine-phosphate synthase enzyme YjbQ [Elusimicrobiota bacterium]|nr:secondary thiamine-phosphate synthase enzyme YjbQ [Elusimicrobiota bacterium]MDH5661774.1 secondary thiamine-phosphate synthase enzyme YjbQ [Elusimicrobiota bacterium]